MAQDIKQISGTCEEIVRNPGPNSEYATKEETDNGTDKGHSP